MLAEITVSDLTSWWAPALAFAAGLLSFASPCVFPLVPGYISFVSGDRAVEDEAARPVVPILLFIAGFAAVFTALGAFTTSVVPAIKGVTGQRIAGAVVIVFGLLMVLYALQRGSVRLYAEQRPFLQKVRPGPAWAAPLGMAFAAGWTPCLGPVLGGILGLASQGGTVRAMALLLCYSAGLGVPFLLVGLGIQRFMGAFGWVKRNYRVIAGVSGGLLMAVGVLLLTGEFTRLFTHFSSGFSWL
jgi:cytochrome c-type biogenesis protein